MRLRRLAIQRLPGIGEPFELRDLGDGVLVVHGPNATGKSSLVRAFRALVDPARSAGGVHVEADFDTAAGPLTARRLGTHVEWERAGQPAEPPRLPEAHRLPGYLLGVEELTAADSATEATIQAEVGRQLAGGYDPAALVRQGGPFYVKQNEGREAKKEFQEAQQRLREAQQTQAGLAAKERELEQARAAHAEADRARQRQGPAERAVDLAGAVAQREATRTELADFPEGMERLRGDETERLRQLRDQRDAAAQRLAEARRNAEAAEARRAETGLTTAPEEEVLSDLDRRLRELEELQRRAREARGREAEARTRAAEHAGNLRLDDESEDSLLTLDPGTVSWAEEELARLEALRAEVAAGERLRDRLPATPLDGPEPASLAAAIADLDGWLATHPPRRRRWPAATAATLLVAGTGTLLALTGLHPAALTAGLAVLATGGYALWPALDLREPEAAARTRAQEDFQRRGLEGPATWDRDGVRNRRQALEERRREAEAAVAAAGERRAREQEVAERQAEVRELADELTPRLAPAGLDPREYPRAAARWLQEAAGLSRARAEAEGAAAEAGTAESEAAGIAEAIATVLAEHGQPVETGAAFDADILHAAVDSLRRRTAEFRAAERDAAEAQREAEREAEQERQHEQAIAALFHEVGLAPDDDTALEQRLERLPAWQAARDRFREAETLIHQGRARLAVEEDLLRRAEAGERDALAEELRALQAQAAAADDHLTRVHELENALKRAREERPVEAAEAQAQTARDGLAEVRDHVLDRRAAAWLLEDVRQEHRAHHRPALLERADAWLADFSRGAFRLELGEDGALEAVDTAAGTRRALAELSTGTRMQLLIAVRAAWALAGEEGREPLPLFLDEALTTTDPERFEAVATSLRTLAAETERQVFYLTAQPADIGRWGLEPQDPHVIDLAAVRGRAIAAPPEALAAPVDQRPPAPEPGEEATDYAHRLGVPPINPWADAGAIHPFYLLRDDLETLHRAITAGGDRLGRLEALLERPGTARLLGDPETLRTRARFARAWLAQWRVGRGRPVSRAVLEDGASPVARSKKLPEIIAVAEAASGDAERLLHDLKEGTVKGLQKKMVEQLADYLADHGYRDERPASTPEDRLRAALNAALMETEMADAEPLATLADWLEAGLIGDKGTEPAAPDA